MHKKKIKALQGIAPTEEELQKLLKLCESEEIEKSDKEVIVSAINLIAPILRIKPINPMI